MDLKTNNQTKWRLLNPDPEKTQKISRIVGCNQIVAKILVNRGITTPEEAFTFLNPSFQHLTDPFALKDMKKAVERIYTAICNKEKILIFGDFDADGITATVILNEFLNYVEADVSWYIPHRIKEGYSLKLHHIEMAVKQKCDLIITVDCGSDSYDAVKRAIREDIDIIITDHHEIRGFRPPAFAVINPKRADCDSGLEHLAGVGVAFYLITALRSYLREKEFWEEICEPKLIEYTDLFAIGTIADMVPLKAENRILSKAGISLIKKGKRAGLNSLIKISGIDKPSLNSDDISFKIAPRINAAGRISHSRICVDLLSEKKSAKADQTAFILEELNKKRQDIERWIMEDIERRITLNPNILKKASIVMQDKTWNVGVLGIVASKIAKKYLCPVVLISTAASTTSSNLSAPTDLSNSSIVAPISNNSNTTSNYATGSCRSVGNINIHEALSKCSDLLENFGGHFMAAGISIKPENIEKFADRFENEILNIIATNNLNLTPEIVIDATLNIDEITEKLVDEIESLRPYGTENPEPLFYCSDLKVVSSFMIISKHRKMVLEQMNLEPINKKIYRYEEQTIEKQNSDNRDISHSINKSSKTIEAMQFNVNGSVESQNFNNKLISISKTLQSSTNPQSSANPEYFKKIAFKVKLNRFSGKNTPQIFIEHT
ncbi:MAG: single-stranded-DNA-specific exonuclease RecJ [Desulfamplus sp.]|nr:single-stranded-DNA-specific exonuclease RecJ [Desulfamplus sp.]